MTTETKTSQKRTCIKCRQEKDSWHFKRTSSPYFPGKRSLICTSCYEKMTDPEDFDSIDALCRYLDLPFDLNEWTRLYKIHGEHTLTAYFEMLTDDKYDAATWREENQRWLLARKEKTIDDEIKELGEAKLKKLRKKWSDSYNEEDLLFLENFYNQIVATQNVSTPILQRYAADLCEISLLITKGLRAGADVKKLMDSRDNIIKVGGFDAKTAKNVSDFDSVGELMVYCVKKGWHPNWAHEKQDVVDMTMHNVQQYLQRLVVNEGSLTEQVEARRETYNTSKRLEEDQLSDEAMKKYEETAVDVDYEGEDDLASDLSEWEI